MYNIPILKRKIFQSFFVTIPFMWVSSCLSITANMGTETPTLINTPLTLPIMATAAVENVNNYNGPYLIPVVDHLEVWGIAEDPENKTIWFLAKGELTDSQIALINYDGENVKVYKVPTSAFPDEDCPRISDLASDASESIWFSNSCYIFHFDTGAWTIYNEADGIPSWLTGSLVADNAGNIWVGNDQGVSRFDGSGWELYEVGEEPHVYRIGSMVALPNNIIWFGGLKGIASFDGATWNTYEMPGNRSRNDSPYAIDMFVSKDGRIWVLNSTEPHLSYFDGTVWTVVSGIPEHYQLESILVEPNGHIWVGSHRLLYFDGEQWVEFAIVARYIVQAKDGTVWLGTERGLYKIKPSE